MDRSPGFGSITYDLYRPFQTRFHFGSIPYEVLNLAIYNNSLDRSTKSTISRFKSLYLLVNIGFQVLFHSPPGVLFTFPSRYYTLSVTRSYLALGDGPPFFRPGSTCPAVLWIPATHFLCFTYKTFTLFGLAFQLIQLHSLLCLCRSETPSHIAMLGLGFLPFRSPLLRKLDCFLSFPPGT